MLCVYIHIAYWFDKLVIEWIMFLFKRRLHLLRSVKENQNASENYLKSPLAVEARTHCNYMQFLKDREIFNEIKTSLFCIKTASDSLTKAERFRTALTTNKIKDGPKSSKLIQSSVCYKDLWIKNSTQKNLIYLSILF
jgi:hypothetical protein